MNRSFVFIALMLLCPLLIAQSSVPLRGVGLNKNLNEALFPFYDDLETDTAWTRDINYCHDYTGIVHSGEKSWEIGETGGNLTYLMLNHKIDLSKSQNPYISFWETVQGYFGTYGYLNISIDVSTDGGYNFQNIGSQGYGVGDWKRVEYSLAAYRPQSVLIRIGVSNNYATAWGDGPHPVYLDDFMIDDAPVPTSLVLNNATNNGFHLAWGQSKAADFSHYRMIISTDPNKVTNYYTTTAVYGRTETRVVDFFDKTRIDTTLTDLCFTNTHYYARLFEEDTQGYTNEGTETQDINTAFTVTVQKAPFTQDFEGTFKWAADIPWTLTSADAADTGHSATHAFEDSPDGVYAAAGDRCLTFEVDLSNTVRPYLSFKNRYSFNQSQGDYGSIEYSTNNANWSQLASVSGTEYLWQQECYDLSFLKPYGNVFLRFRSYSASNINSRDGWHIDDISVLNNSVTVSFPFSDDMENENLTKLNWIPGRWQLSTQAHSGTNAWSLKNNTGSTALTLASGLNLTNAINPFVLLWLQGIGPQGEGCYVNIQASADDGANWSTIGNMDFSGPTTWKKLFCPLTNFRQPNVIIRIFSSNGNASYTIYADDILVDNFPAPTSLVLSNPTNNGMRVSWGKSSSAYFYRYRLVLSTDENQVTYYNSTNSVQYRNETRVIDLYNQSTLDTTISDLTFFGTKYFAKLYEEDTRGYINQGTETISFYTASTMAAQPAPFTQNFEGSFQWAADLPWAVTANDSAEPNHSAIKAMEDSPNGTSAAFADRNLLLHSNLTATQRPVLRFSHKYSFNSAQNDIGKIEWSTDNINWNSLAAFRGTEYSWQQEEYDLSFLKSSGDLFIRFNSLTNADKNLFDGWHLDDVGIYSNTRTISFPFIDDMENDSICSLNWIPGEFKPVTTMAHSGSKAWTLKNWHYGELPLTMAGPTDLSKTTNPFISYWFKAIPHNTNGTYIIVQSSTDAGANWTDIAARSYITNYLAWTKFAYSLSAYRMANVQFRILISYPNDYEIYIDDVVIGDGLSDPVLLSPANNSQNNFIPVTFNWNAISGVSFYRFQLATDASLSEGLLVVNDTVRGTSSRTLSNLQPYTTYYWRILGQNETESTPWSSIWRFSTLQEGTAPTWSINLNFSHGGNTVQTLTFGLHQEATEGLDSFLGEIEMPPIPPFGAFDARFNLPGESSIASAIDFRSDTTTQAVWNLRFQPGTAGYPVFISWDSTQVPAGNLFITDDITGNLITINMKEQGSYVVTNSGIQALRITYTLQLCPDIKVANGWNMISVPVRTSDMGKTSLFPTATSPAYGFDNGYFTSENLQSGLGYWLRFDSPQQFTMCGSGVQNGQLSLSQGWNMIGPFNTPVSVNDLYAYPENMIASYFFGFHDTYYMADTLKPGKGYWVKANTSGMIFMGQIPAYKHLNKVIPLSINEVDKSAAKLLIQDAAGRNMVLYLAAGNASTGYELPPIPPSGIFDVRFASNSITGSLLQDNQLRLNSAVYPVRLKIQGASVTIKDIITGKIVNHLLLNGKDFLLTNSKLDVLSISGVEKPLAYELSQNYPNPFNPTTTFRFALPADSKVVLSVFNTLGEKVAEVLNDIQSAGYTEIPFNASSLASGIYFYKLEATPVSGGNVFVQTKKMLLLK